MAKGVYVSKMLAIATVVLAVSAVSGIVVMFTLYQIQISKTKPIKPTTPEPTTQLPTGPPPTLRLPKNLIPESYQVVLHPYFYTRLPNNAKQLTNFKGNSTVRFKCIKPTRSIFLHAVNLTISKVQVISSYTRKNFKVRSYKLHINESSFFEVQLEDVLEGNGGFYDLFTEFEGELGDLIGLYLSQYEEKNEETGKLEERFLVASQMESVYARRVFPCFDEPALKAVFDITMIHRPKATALSNGKKGNTQTVVIEKEEWTVSKFNPTPIMSTYILAFSINEFGFKKDNNNEELKIWARPEAIAAGHANHALEVSVKILRYFEERFEFKYSARKLDQIAVPDFESLGMENWGLTMYSESALLYEEEVSSIQNKELVTNLIAHELAHQWFGNLVTMNWWNDLWLKEGFATYFANFGVDAVEPEWNTQDLFILRESRLAMEVDSLSSTLPLCLSANVVQEPDIIMELFNVITYKKGAALLRMLSSYMTESEFLNGIQCYLQTHRYNSTVTDDLWSCMQKQTDEKIKEVMNPWTVNAGYPVIMINISSGEIVQEHFHLNRKGNPELEWQIPIFYMKSNKEVNFYLMKDKGPVRTPVFEIENDAWLLANVNGTGYYRINYNEENWNRLLNQLDFDHRDIPVINRGQLIDDAFNLARAKYINVSLALQMTKYLKNETEYVPWQSALSNLQYFILMFDRSEVYGPIQKYMRNQIKPLYEFYSEFTNKSVVPKNLADQYNQINAISVACSNGVPECIKMASKLFNEWRNGTNRIPPNLKSTIYCNAIAAGDEDDWDFAWKKYQEATIATEKNALRKGLSCTKKIWLLSRYLDYSLDPKKIKKTESLSTISLVAENVAGQALAWDFVRANWPYISEEYEYGLSSGNLLEKVTERFSTEFELQQLKEFKNKYEDDELSYIKQALEYSIERTTANIIWVKENKANVLDWFSRAPSS